MAHRGGSSRGTEAGFPSTGRVPASAPGSSATAAVAPSCSRCWQFSSTWGQEEPLDPCSLREDSCSAGVTPEGVRMAIQATSCGSKVYLGLILAAAIAAGMSACGDPQGAGDGSASSPLDGGGRSPTVSPSASGTRSQTPTPTQSQTGTSTPGGSPSQDPTGPDFTLFSLPRCSVVPRGQLSGADGLTIFVALRNSGPGTWSSLVPYSMVSDTGLRQDGNSAISTGSSFSGMQVDLASTDYNRSHTFTVTADPANTVVERDESNNQLQVRVNLPSAPQATTDVPCSIA